MINKIAFLCTNPREGFLPPISQLSMKDCYYHTRNEALLREESLYCREKIEIYGESVFYDEDPLFLNDSKNQQIIYVQTSDQKLIQKVFAQADLVFMGISGSRQVCDRIFLSILPWMEKPIFLWDEKICDKNYLMQLQKEYQLKDTQMMDAKKLPTYLLEAFHLYAYDSVSEDVSSSLFSGR